MAKGDIVLITFPFTDLSGSKLRPAVVLAENNLDIIVCFITTQLNWQEPTDISIIPNEENHLKQNSLIRISKIATLDQKLVKGLLGKISTTETESIDRNLKLLLNLS